MNKFPSLFFFKKNQFSCPIFFWARDLIIIIIIIIIIATIDCIISLYGQLIAIIAHLIKANYLAINQGFLEIDVLDGE